MQSRFDEVPDDAPSLTPKLAERVVARFLERQEAREREVARERERLAEVARVQELADLLGTTPEDVAALAREVGDVRPRPAVPATVVRSVGAASRWRVHAAYLAVIAAVLAVGAIRRPARTPLFPLATGALSGSGLRYDPYVGGTVRESVGSTPFSLGETPLVDRALVAPPAGLKVALVTPFGRKSIAGPPGPVPDTPEAAHRLREAILSLLDYEERQVRVDGSIPTVDYGKAAVVEGTQNWGGRPTYVGWHQVEVTDGRRVFRRLLPDGRYAKDLARFVKARDERLAAFLDTKFFPSLPPANLRPGSRRLADSPRLPRGTALMVWNDRGTVWLRGAGDGAATRKDLTAEIDAARAKLPPAADPKAVVNVAAIYPGGETYDWWPVEGTEVTHRREGAGALAKAIDGAIMAEGSIPERGRIEHRRADAPTYTVDTESGAQVTSNGASLGIAG